MSSIIASRPPGIKPIPAARRPRRRPNPRDSWPAWTDAYSVTIPEEPRPTAGPDFEPSPKAAAWNAGYALGYELEVSAVPPSEMPEAVALSWWLGRNTGMTARQRRDAEARRSSSPRPNLLTDADVYPAGCAS